MIRRYVIKEYIINLLVSVIFFYGILFTAQGIRFLRKGVDASLLIKVAGYIFIYLLSSVLPTALLTAGILTAGRMEEDSEITLLKSAGINLHSVFLPVYFLGIILAIGVFLVEERLKPFCQFKLYRLLRENMINMGKNKIIYGYNVIELGNYRLIVSAYYKNRLYGVILQRFEKEELSDEVVAEVSSIPHCKSGKLYIVLQNGSITHFDRKKRLPTLMFKKYKLTIGKVQSISKRIKDLTINQMKKILSQKVDVKIRREILLRIHKKYAMILTTFLFTLLGIIIGVISGHSGKIFSFGISIIIVFCIYYPIMIGLESLVLKREFSYIIGAWGPPFLVGVMCSVMIRKL